MTVRNGTAASRRERWVIDTCVSCGRKVTCGINQTYCRHCGGYVEVAHIAVVSADELQTAIDQRSYFEGEVKRLQRCVDVAFKHASGGDARSARVALTEARWGR